MTEATNDTPEHLRLASDLEAEDEAARKLAAEEAEAAIQHYLERHPPAFHPVIRRHGIPLFHLCYLNAVASGALAAQIDAISLAIHTMAQAPSKRPIAEEVQRASSKAVRTLQGVFSETLTGLLVMHGFSQEAYNECLEDLTRAAQLTGGTDRGLILMH